MYWNGSTWTSEPSTFSVGWRAMNPIVECETNRQLGDGYDGKTGLLIPISTSLSGRMSLEMMQTDGNTITNVELETLEVEYVRKNSAKQVNTQKSIEMKGSTGVDCLDEYNQSCMFCTSPKVNGYGSVADFNGIPLVVFNYNGRRFIPEAYRMNTIKNWMDNPLSVLDIEIKDSDPLINRYETVGESDDWPEYSILAVGHDWRESKLKVKLIES